MRSVDLAYKFTVVMATYFFEKASNLDDALKSIFEQSVTPDEVILVVDGDIGTDQKKVIQKFSLDYDFFSVIWLDENVGRGKARNIGVENAKHDLIAIMDSDDIACFDRFKLTIDALISREVDLVSSLQEEFDGFTGQSLAVKQCPEFDYEIKKSLLFSCVISNPSIIFKKTAWVSVGGFPDFQSWNEDYLFFLRLKKAGFKFYCVREPLIHVRISTDQKNRRAGLDAFKSDLAFRLICVKEKHHSIFYAIFILIVFGVKRFSPKMVRNFLNYVWRRRNVGSGIDCD
jgi:glycosyltransferase involved in cell wall biosynthesis